MAHHRLPPPDAVLADSVAERVRAVWAVFGRPVRARYLCAWAERALSPRIADLPVAVVTQDWATPDIVVAAGALGPSSGCPAQVVADLMGACGPTSHIVWSHSLRWHDRTEELQFRLREQFCGHDVLFVGGPDPAGSWLVGSARVASATVSPAGSPVRCEIPGVVLSLAVAVGGRVATGDEIGILESMKMEIPVLAPLDGVVVALGAEVGDAVATGHVLVRIEGVGDPTDLTVDAP